jgi:preprotein translocase subunit SecG
MLYILLIFLYIVVSVFLILVVLLQTGKRADLAGAFGGGGSQTALGTRGAANLLTKLTTVSAVLFMLIALTLSIISARRVGESRSVLDEVSVPATAPAPAPAPGDAPATAPPAAQEPAPAETDVDDAAGEPAEPAPPGTTDTP